MLERWLRKWGLFPISEEIIKKHFLALYPQPEADTERAASLRVLYEVDFERIQALGKWGGGADF